MCAALIGDTTALPVKEGAPSTFKFPQRQTAPLDGHAYPKVFIREILFTTHMGALNLFCTFPTVLATSGMCLSTNQVQVTDEKHGKNSVSWKIDWLRVHFSKHPTTLANLRTDVGSVIGLLPYS